MLGITVYPSTASEMKEFVVKPKCLPMLSLIAAACIYSLALWLAALCWRHGKRGHTPQAKARSIAVQIVMCPPFALNAVRRLSLAYEPACNWAQAAHGLQTGADWQHTADALQEVISTELADAQALQHPAPRIQPLQAAAAQLAQYR